MPTWGKWRVLARNNALPAFITFDRHATASFLAAICGTFPTKAEPKGILTEFSRSWHGILVALSRALLRIGRGRSGGRSRDGRGQAMGGSSCWKDEVTEI